jgi:hypothetical protein
MYYNGFLVYESKNTTIFFNLKKRNVTTSVDFVKDIHQVDSLVTCGNEAFFPFGAMAHRTRLSLLGACGGMKGTQVYASQTLVVR